MLRTHRIPVHEAGDLRLEDLAWMSFPMLSVDLYRWAAPQEYRPSTTARLVRCPDRLAVWMETDEQPLLARARHLNEDVFKDSCMEFFIQPDPQDARYLNFEFNPLGTLLIGFGPDRASRVRLTVDPGRFAIQSRYGADRWTLRWEIPDRFLQELGLTGPAPAFRGNFYKCGDETIHPHYGTWNPVVCPAPDFHRPEHFGGFVVTAMP